MCPDAYDEGDALSAFLWYMRLEKFELKFEILELCCAHIKVILCAADANVLG